MNEFSEYWAVTDSYLRLIQGLLERAEGFGFPVVTETDTITAKRADSRTAKAAGGSIGIVPIYGLLMQRSSWLLDWLGGTSMEDFNRDLDTFVNDSDVKVIVLDVDSGGGSVFGIEETTKKILAARERKPILAVSNSTMASAAYWLSASASKIFAAPTSETGSIGTLAIHTDQSGSDTMLGVRRTIIKQGNAKALGNVFEPLTAEARDEIQRHVNRYYEMFVRSVAKGRGVTAGQVEKNYGQGRVFGPQEAKEIGMIDGIATLDEVLSSLQSKKGNRGAGTRAGYPEDEKPLTIAGVTFDSVPALLTTDEEGMHFDVKESRQEPGDTSETGDSATEEEEPSGRDAGLLRRRLKLAASK